MTPFEITRPLTQPTEGAELLDRPAAKALGLIAGYDKSGRERLRYGTRLSPRLTHPHTLARIESAVRDERYLEAV